MPGVGSGARRGTTGRVPVPARLPRQAGPGRRAVRQASQITGAVGRDRPVERRQIRAGHRITGRPGKGRGGVVCPDRDRDRVPTVSATLLPQMRDSQGAGFEAAAVLA